MSTNCSKWPECFFRGTWMAIVVFGLITTRVFSVFVFVRLYIFGLITTRVFSVFVFVRLYVSCAMQKWGFFKRVVTYDNLIQ
jgi:hypothetical protein